MIHSTAIVLAQYTETEDTGGPRQSEQISARWTAYPPDADYETVRIIHAGLTLALMSGLMKTSHQLSLSCSRAVSLAFALLCFVGSASSSQAASTDPRTWPPTAAQVTSQFAFVDFDGDRRPDLATVQAGQGSSWATQYWIAFQLSRGSPQTLGVIAPTGGLQITSRDVNSDSFLDVVVTTEWTNQPVAVLLNDGQGNFTASDPSAFPGAFRTSEKSWICITDEIKDAVALLLSRYRTGNCPASSSFSSPRNLMRLLVMWASRNSLSSIVVSFLGRAPPSLVLHI